MAQHGCSHTPCAVGPARADTGDGGTPRGRRWWTVVSVGNQIMWSGHGGCRCLKVKLFRAEAEPGEDSPERQQRVLC